MSVNAAAEIRRFLGLIVKPGQVFEVRAIDCKDQTGRFKSTVAGFFNDIEAAAKGAAALDAQARAEAIYVTLNPLKPAMLALAVNRFVERIKKTTADADVLRRSLLLIDADPIRPSGVSSTDVELAESFVFIEKVRDHLTGLGWPLPIETMSGNGAGLIYAIDEPANAEGLALVSGVVGALAARFNTAAVKVDESVINAARVTKLAGTHARKGDHLEGMDGIEDRPHRQSQIVRAPDALAVVTTEQLKQVAESRPATAAPDNGQAAQTKPRNGRAPTFEKYDATPDGVASYLSRHGVRVKGRSSDNGSALLHLEACPVNPEITSTCKDDIVVIVSGAGKVAYKNQHDRGINYTWYDVRETLEPGFKAWVDGARRNQAVRQNGDAPAPASPPAVASPPPADPEPSIEELSAPAGGHAVRIRAAMAAGVEQKSADPLFDVAGEIASLRAAEWGKLKAELKRWRDEHGIDVSIADLSRAATEVRRARDQAARDAKAPPPPPKEPTPAPRGEDVIEFPEPLRLAEHYLRTRARTRDGHLTLRRYRKEWWQFHPVFGGYAKVEDEAFRAGVYQHLDTLWTPKRDKDGNETGELEKVVAKVHLVKEVDHAVTASETLATGDMPQWLDGRAEPHPASVVAFRNGLLDTDSYCTGEGADAPTLIPRTPLWFSGVGCPYDFDPAATCPAWLRFLGEVFNADADSIDLLQEWFGINLIPDNRYERFMMLVGPPRAGKGTVLHAMLAMLGDEQVGSTNFSALASRFGREPILARLAAILPDAHVARTTDAKAALEVLKTITGNDPVGIDRKGIKELPNVKLYCRFTIAVNELPELPDEAGALKTRLLLLYFRNTYAGRENANLKRQVAREAPGIAAWAIEGLRRLRLNGRFTTPEKSRTMIEEFEKIVSPVLGFLDECCEVAPADGSSQFWVGKDDLFAKWESWCKERGSEPGNKSKFGQSLVNAGKGIKAIRRGPRGQQFNVYDGIRLSN